MKRRATTLGLGLLLLWTGCSAGYRVYRVSAMDHLDFPAIYYALPHTVLQTDVTVKRKATSPGPCGEFAELAKRLGIDPDDVATRASIEYTIDDVKLTNRMEADPEAVFAVRVDEDRAHNRNHTVELTDSSLLGNANVEVTSKVEDYILKPLDVAAGLVGTVLKYMGLGAPERVLQAAPASGDKTKQQYCENLVKTIEHVRQGRVEFYTAGRAPLNVSKDTFDAAVKQLDEVEKQLLSAFTGTFSEKTAVVHCEHTPPARYRDDLSAVNGFVADEKRKLFGFSPHTGVSWLAKGCYAPKTMAMVEDNKNAVQSAVAKAFTIALHAKLKQILGPKGAADAQKLADSFTKADDFARRMASIANELIARNASLHDAPPADDRKIDADLALLLDGFKKPPGAALASNAPLPPAAATNKSPAAKTTAEPPQDALPKALDLMKGEFATELRGEALVLEVTVEPDQIETMIAKKQRTPKQVEGFFYRVPGYAQVQLGVEHDQRYPRARTRMAVPQYGAINYLPGVEDVRSTAAKYGLEVFSDLGSLKKFTNSSTAFNPETITSAGQSIGKVVDAAGAARSAQDAKELNALKKQKELLEQKKAIRDLEKELNAE